MQLSEFQANLYKSGAIKDLARRAAFEVQRRNEDVFSWATEGNAHADYDDDLDVLRGAILAEVRRASVGLDLTDHSSISDDGDKFDDLKLALSFAERAPGAEFNLDVFVRVMTFTLVAKSLAGIDEYVESMADVRLLNALSIPFDDSNYLVDISNSQFELRDHSLIAPGNVMIYPHQFMRRFYSSNFVGLPALLRGCLDRGLTVKLRVDPLRSWVDPSLDQAMIEEDYWHGAPFDLKLLGDTDSKQKLTFHRSFSPSHSGYPVSVTIFRSYMMAPQQRQFMVEEYTPLVDPVFLGRRLPGFGKRYCVQKFAHFVYDQDKRVFTHLDGAVRSFAIDDFAAILEAVERGGDPDSKIGERHKLFLVEGSIDVKVAYPLLYEFFMYNPHIEEYFGPSLGD